MKIAFSTLGCPDFDWPDIYSMAKDLGFDGIEMGKYFLPSLTTIVQPQEEIARKSVEVLLEMMTGRGSGRHVTLPAALARRESVAAPRK